MCNNKVMGKLTLYQDAVFSRDGRENVIGYCFSDRGGKPILSGMSPNLSLILTRVNFMLERGYSFDREVLKETFNDSRLSKLLIDEGLLNGEEEQGAVA